MEFGREKYAMLIMKSGKRETVEKFIRTLGGKKTTYTRECSQ